jgi:hypothetical protein
MNRRNTLWTATAALLLLAVLFFGYRRFFNEPVLTVHLRCGANTSGKLSIAKILPNGETGKEETFVLADACQAGKIEIGGHDRQASIQITFERGNGERHKITFNSQEIQSDQNGFYVVLKMIENPPFITKDSI